MSARAVRQALKELADPERAAFYPRFFKTGRGEYGEGDKFWGVTVPKQRRVAKRFKALSERSLVSLLADPIHECRLTALLIMVGQFQQGDPQAQSRIVQLYLDNLDQVNNWDLVDASADKILGASLENGDRGLLYEMAARDQLWHQRIAMIATHHFIRQDDFQDALRIAERLLNHEHDLIHKASGWMLREVGKRDRKSLTRFLDRHHKKMPRTMLRYSLEKLDAKSKAKYMAK